MAKEMRLLIKVTIGNQRSYTDSIDMKSETVFPKMTKEFVDGELTEKLHKMYTDECYEKSIQSKDYKNIKDKDVFKNTFTIQVLGWFEFE